MAVTKKGLRRMAQKTFYPKSKHFQSSASCVYVCEIIWTQYQDKMCLKLPKESWHRGYFVWQSWCYQRAGPRTQSAYGRCTWCRARTGRPRRSCPGGPCRPGRRSRQPWADRRAGTCRSGRCRTIRWTKKRIRMIKRRLLHCQKLSMQSLKHLSNERADLN